MSYAGESWEKKIARADYWRSVARTPPPKGTVHVVLASEECGDFPTAAAAFSERGLPAPHLIGVDRDVRAIEIARERWPSYDLRFGEVGEVARGETMGHVFLDLCCGLSSEIVTLAQRLASRLPEYGSIGVAYMRGREGESMSGGVDILGNRRERRAYAKRVAQLGGLAGRIERRQLFEEGERREDVLQSALVGALRFEVGRVYLASYLGHRTPMGVARFLMLPPVTAGRLCRCSGKTWKQVALGSCRKCGGGAPVARITREGTSEIYGEEASKISSPSVIRKGTGEALVRARIIGGDDPRLYNVAPATAAAWRAHATRGTYERES